jgi:hypothetical protein
MEELQILAIITAVVALIPATWIPLHIYRARKFDSACNVFRSAFDNELAFLVSNTEPISSLHGTTHNVLTEALNKHTHAADVFRGVLPKRKRKGFNKAWKNYLYPNGYNEAAPFPLLDYADYANCKDLETRKFAHSKITELLNYAK